MGNLTSWSKFLVALWLATSLPALPSSALTAPIGVQPESSSTANTGVDQAAAKVTWQAVTSNDLVGYSVFAFDEGLAIAGSTPTCQNNECVSFFSDLSGGTEYSIVVSSIDVNGGSSASAPVSFTAISSPASPGQLASSVGNGQVSLSWTEPTSLGGLSLLDYQVTGPDGFNRTVPSSSTSMTISGLTNGSAYVFQIRARNSNGFSSTVSFPVATPVGVPATPARPAVSTTSTAVTVTWVAPSNGGSPITGYKARLYKDGEQVFAANGISSGTRSYTFNNIEPGSYTVRIIATNAQGDSALSPESQVVSLGGSLVTQTINFEQPIPQTFPGSLNLTLSVDSGLPLTLSAVGPCTVDSLTRVVTFTGVGLCEITATQLGDATRARTSVSRSFTIQQAPSGGSGSDNNSGMLALKVSSISQTLVTSSNTIRLGVRGEYLDLVTAVKVGTFSAEIVSKTPSDLLATFPALPAGQYEIVFTYGSTNQVMIQILTISTRESVASSSPVPDSASVSNESRTKKVTIGTFKGYVAIYFKGYQDSKASVKLAGKWISVLRIQSDFYRLVRNTGAGYQVRAQVFVDKKLVRDVRLTTR